MGQSLLHLSPHPDDDLIGAPGILFALRDAGWRIVNLACSLGRPEDQARRVVELREASERARFELVVADRPLGAGADDGDERSLGREIACLVDELAPAVVMSPSPHDRHPTHELVGRLCAQVLGRCFTDGASGGVGAPRWWQWGIWGPLELPTLALPYDVPRMEEILHALEAHAGELRRNDYRRLVRSRAAMHASLLPEVLFGFGAGGADQPFADAVTELCADRGRWLLGHPRWLDASVPLAGPDGTDVGPTEIDVTGWVGSPSIAAVVRELRQRSTPGGALAAGPWSLVRDGTDGGRGRCP